MSIGEWSGLRNYTVNDINQNVEDKPGVYRLSSKNSDGNFIVFYVGRSDHSLKERLKDHLSPGESNSCIKKEVQKECRYRFVYVTTQKERENLEAAQISEWSPKCNTQLK
jgi:excinuclease UvrABC nuclease subunit